VQRDGDRAFVNLSRDPLRPSERNIFELASQEPFL
jgi:hypothetical protein